MTITREQLELAALADGRKIYAWCVRCGDQIAYADIGPEESVAWRPHTDIADTARLAVKLGMWVNRGMASAVVNGEPVEVVIEHDDTEADMERAYCYAITLCAAEIGRRMKEAK